MTASQRASVLIVDDDPDSRGSLVEDLRGSLSFVEVAHPNDVHPQQLLGVDLVLVDYFLEHWPERDVLEQIALRPLDGVALTGVLRAHAEACRDDHTPAFALLSGKLHDLSPDFPPEHRLHVLASSRNLEWVFQKGRPQTRPQIVALAKAMRDMPRIWKLDKPGEALSRLAKLLNLDPEMPGQRLAVEDVEKCHPPIHELSETSHGLSVIRWLLHRILPYPAFLVDPLRLAARLRVEPTSLERALARAEGMREALGEIEYSGILAGFLGPRWWRSGVEAWIWDLTDGHPHQPELIRRALVDLGAQDLVPVDSGSELICLDSNHQPLTELARFDEAVRIQPDPWPPYADQAWALISDVKDNPALRALVIQDDLELLA